jgi:hypothetical protein
MQLASPPHSKQVEISRMDSDWPSATESLLETPGDADLRAERFLKLASVALHAASRILYHLEPGCKLGSPSQQSRSSLARLLDINSPNPLLFACWDIVLHISFCENLKRA